MVKRRGPVVGRRKLGKALRRLREAADLKGADVARQLKCVTSRISRIEGGDLVPNRDDLRIMLEMYGVEDDSERQLLFDLLTEANRKGWYESYGRIMHPKFQVYIGLETDATALNAYETVFVHGLLQTSAYAHAIIDATMPRAYPEEVDELSELRVKRQEALTRSDDPLQLWAILEEGAIRRPVGGSSTMRAQVEHLLQVTELPSVHVQIMPTSVGAHAGLSGPFTIMEFDQEIPDILFVESQGGNLYLEKPADLRRCKLTMNLLRDKAAATEESRRLLMELAKEHE
ncbi:transcriptional regulator with XRE-family HTH domain [Spinactinospora alkalitolerans]|uniref:Transcriptional regulator with XRE-family HTH domain n=1 Tax=Spinactinospora alkalitolerans TaxID=687207 RepID=A0A852U2N8_9ACTN|nr:helix-turn-helix transcriptional regulator [Spinactinospora alkalitolerans]NYE50469.1 transcriptional regulator with XRE-family HTH domain [Spinactinospora alkalitolerans]